jgi:hypothetical protein
VFSFGELFSGSVAGTRLNQPVVGMVASGTGYLLVGADGGVFTFGNRFFGSLGGRSTASAIRAIAPSLDGGGALDGYWMLDGSGGVYAFGSVWLP